MWKLQPINEYKQQSINNKQQTMPLILQVAACTDAGVAPPDWEHGRLRIVLDARVGLLANLTSTFLEIIPGDLVIQVGSTAHPMWRIM